MTDEFSPLCGHSQFRRLLQQEVALEPDVFNYYAIKEGSMTFLPILKVRYVVPILATGASALGFFALSMLLATPVMA